MELGEPPKAGSSRDELKLAWKSTPVVDYFRLRADIDAILNQALGDADASTSDD